MSCRKQTSHSAREAGPALTSLSRGSAQTSRRPSKFCRYKRGEERMKAQGQSDTGPTEYGHQRAVIKHSQVRNVRNPTFFSVCCRNNELGDQKNNSVKGLSQLLPWFWLHPSSYSSWTVGLALLLVDKRKGTCGTNGNLITTFLNRDNSLSVFFSWIILQTRSMKKQYGTWLFKSNLKFWEV